MPVSIRGYFDPSHYKRADALLRMAQLLLEGVRLHAVEGDSAECRKFQSDVQSVEKKLNARTPPSEVLVLAGSIIKALEDYNRSTTRLIRRHSRELQEMVTMLAETLAAISSASDRSVNALQTIESRLKQAAVMEDIGTLKASLGECLEDVREETVRWREETAQMITSLNQALKDSEAPSSGGGPLPATGKRDPLTGLGDRPTAEKQLGAALHARRHSFAVLFLLPQIPTLNAHFGYEVVDQLLLLECQHISMGLPPDVPLYRWSGASFLAIIDSPDSIGQVKRNLRELTPGRLKKTLNVDGREVFVIARTSSKILPIFEFSGQQDLIRAIDLAVAEALRE